MNLLIPVAVLAAGGGAFLLLRKKKTPAQVQAQAAAAAVPTPQAAGSDELPPELQTVFAQLLAQGQDPDAIDFVAQQLDGFGFNKQAAALRAKSAALRAARAAAVPTPAPVPAPIPQIPSPAAPTATALPILTYNPDTRPMSDPSAYYFNPANGKHAKIDVRSESTALRFLGFNAPVDPGGGTGLASDVANSAGSYNPQLMAAVRQFQSSSGLAADGWIGPNTINALAQAVGQLNAQNDAANRTAGVANVSFSGWSTYAPGQTRHALSKHLFAGNMAYDGTHTAHHDQYKQGRMGWSKERGWHLDKFGAVSTLAPGVAFGARSRPGFRSGRAYTPKNPVASRVCAPGGCRIRSQPSATSPSVDVAPKGATVAIRQHVAGAKTDATSPGPGGWAYVSKDQIAGWMPSEWLEPLGVRE